MSMIQIDRETARVCEGALDARLWAATCNHDPEQMATLKRALDRVRAALDAPQPPAQPSKSAAEIRALADEYLGNGGLFNPELMDHEKVRDLIIRMRDMLAPLDAPQDIPLEISRLNNLEWLLERIDEMHAVLCPDRIGTWQQRTEQVRDAVLRLSKPRQTEAIDPDNSRCAVPPAQSDASQWPCSICGAKDFHDAANECRGWSGCPGDAQSKMVFAPKPDPREKRSHETFDVLVEQAAMAPFMPPDPREAFEEEARSRGFDVTRRAADENSYISIDTQVRWNGFQAGFAAGRGR